MVPSSEAGACAHAHNIVLFFAPPSAISHRTILGMGLGLPSRKCQQHGTKPRRALMITSTKCCWQPELQPSYAIQLRLGPGTFEIHKYVAPGFTTWLDACVTMPQKLPRRIACLLLRVDAWQCLLPLGHLSFGSRKRRAKYLRDLHTLVRSQPSTSN